MEYLMTYGWAILVVMIVGFVLWRLGVFSPTGAGEALKYSGFGTGVKPILAGTKLNTGGDFVGMFTNGQGMSIRVISVNITENLAGSDATGTLINDNPIGTGVIIRKGELFKVSGLKLSPTVAAGEFYELRVQITYAMDISGVASNHTAVGTIKGSYEKT